MLIMITNRCNENCPHCMENSNPNGQMMDGRTFHKAVMFAKYIGCSVITVSGGEPTMHPDFFKFCKSLEVDYKMCFTVVSNGTWYNDKKIERHVRRICSGFKYFISMQVYTNKSFYRDYEAIKAKKPFFDSFYGRVIFEESPICSMQDLGRAKTCELAQKMCDESQYHQSCLNANLVARQVNYPGQYGKTLEWPLRQFCHPMVDFNGDVHLSESWLCPSVGNVNEHLFDDIWEGIKDYRPCGQCKGYKKFKESQDPKIVAARMIIEKEIEFE